MFWREILRGVLDAIRSNRIRFLLTLSGVIVGSASMVLLSGLLAGGKEALLAASNDATERDLIEIEDRRPPEKQRRRTRRELEQGDVSALDGSPLLQEARVVGMRHFTGEAAWKREAQMVTVVSARADSLELYRLALARGRFFGEVDRAQRRAVAVIGHKVWTQLFGAPRTLDGLELRIGGARFAVIGVLAPRPQMGSGGPWAWDGRALVPDTTFAATLPIASSDRHRLETIFVRLGQAKALAERIDAVRGVVKATLLRRHYGVENFKLSGEDGDQAGELILLVITLLVMMTAVISLVVGGINVMNIMLVAITERTREIGVRRAVGAPRSLILFQFLAESTFTAALGGLIGVIGGAGLTFLASLILDRVTGAWTFHLVPWAGPAALGAAMFVGATFGIYPAWRASRLDPVEALRFE